MSSKPKKKDEGGKKMDQLLKFGVTDMRCFKGYHELSLKPLTFLVGENSTGKSSLLGFMQAIGDYLEVGPTPFFLRDLDFNSSPYEMGAFRDIVRKSNPLKSSFEAKLEYVSDGTEFSFHIVLDQSGNGSEPQVLSAEWEFSGHKVGVLRRREDLASRGKKFRTIETDLDVSLHFLSKGKVTVYLTPNKNADWRYPTQLQFLGSLIDPDYVPKKNRKEIQSIRDRLANGGLKPGFRLSSLSLVSLAPIRQKPSRTYNPIAEVQMADGGEMPRLFRRLRRESKKEWDGLKQGLGEFGARSGLFSDVSVRPLGESSNDPFQIRVKANGPKANLMDVGYGVSQVMPILSRILKDRGSNTFLLQQPELHLHPKGQAALTSFLVQDLNSHRKPETPEKEPHGRQFILETHSDHMIDRARIEIMNGNISHEDVGLIYLEPKYGSVRIHNISINEDGDLIDPPLSYREFFLSETKKLLGF